MREYLKWKNSSKYNTQNVQENVTKIRIEKVCYELLRECQILKGKDVTKIHTYVRTKRTYIV